VTVTGVTDVLTIAASSDHTLALTAAGTVWAWGAIHVGQLGDGTTIPLGPGVPGQSKPALVPGLTGVVAIAANAVNRHSMALIGCGHGSRPAIAPPKRHWIRVDDSRTVGVRS
jgi:alpha-tubulin suppressor-like RCC1 family protein